jgi:hypothetical protein
VEQVQTVLARHRTRVTVTVARSGATNTAGGGTKLAGSPITATAGGLGAERE